MLATSSRIQRGHCAIGVVCEAPVVFWIGFDDDGAGFDGVAAVADEAGPAVRTLAGVPAGGARSRFLSGVVVGTGAGFGVPARGVEAPPLSGVVVGTGVCLGCSCTHALQRVTSFLASRTAH